VQDALRSSISCYIVVGGFALEQEVADAATDKQRFMAMAAERIADRICQLAGIHGLIMRQVRRRPNKN